MPHKLNVDAIAPYEGPHAIEGVRFRGVRTALGVSAWGMNVIELDPHTTGYPEHDHTADGQEEVYLVLEGSARLHVGDTVIEAVAGDFVRVEPELTRKWVTEAQGVRLLALGGTPGQAYGKGAL